MIIQTARLTLSDISMYDLQAVHDLHSLPETDRYNTLGIPENMDQTQKLISEWIDSLQEFPVKKYVLRISDTANQFIGLIGIKVGRPNYMDAEIWYKLHSAHWNNGYATEAVTGILNFGFNQLNLHRITAGCATANEASARVLEKAGFLKEGMHRKILPIRGTWHDNYSFAILKEDFSG